MLISSLLIDKSELANIFSSIMVTVISHFFFLKPIYNTSFSHEQLHIKYVIEFANKTKQSGHLQDVKTKEKD